MMGSSRASLDSVTDEISEPTHGHSFAGLQGRFFNNPFLLNMVFLPMVFSIWLSQYDFLNMVFNMIFSLWFSQYGFPPRFPDFPPLAFPPLGCFIIFTLLCENKNLS